MGQIKLFFINKYQSIFFYKIKHNFDDIYKYYIEKYKLYLIKQSTFNLKQSHDNISKFTEFYLEIVSFLRNILVIFKITNLITISLYSLNPK